MSPVLTDNDVTILMSQRTSDGTTLYLYPVVRDVDVLLTDEDDNNEYENLGELLAAGVKPSFKSLQEIFQNSDDISFNFDSETGTVIATHTSLLDAGSVSATDGEVGYGSIIEIPTFSFDKNGHITSVGKSVITLPNEYKLPKASTNTLGGIIIGDGLSIDTTGIASVKSASEDVAGIVKLNSMNNSESTTEAATPKAVSDALAAAISYIDNEVSKINMDGVTPNYGDLANMFTTSEDMEFKMDEVSRTFSVTHRKTVDAGEIIGTEGSVSAGSIIKIPAFSIDNKGHVVSNRLVEVTIPEAYTLPSASDDVRGGIIIGDGLEIDPETGKTKVREASLVQYGQVKLNSNYESDSETEAATPKSVNDARKSANEFATSEAERVKDELNNEGVNAKFESISAMIGSSNDINVDVDTENEVIKVTHKNTINAGTASSGSTKLFNGGSILIPTFTYDSNGHLVEVDKETVEITPFAGNKGIVVENEYIGHSNEIESGSTDTTTSKKLSFGEEFKVPVITYDDNGHITGVATSTLTLPDNEAIPYSGTNGIVVDGTEIKHVNNITSGNITPGNNTNLGFGDVIKVPSITYDNNGHITGTSLVEFELPANPNVTYTLTQTGDKIVLEGSDGSSYEVEGSKYVHPESGVPQGTYKSVTVDNNGHVVAGFNPTTLSEYGITDAAEKTHQHTTNDIISLDGSKITGVIPIEAIPAGALERLVPVSDESAMYALTADDVQLGDTVQLNDTKLMYLVVDTGNLNNSKGYREYTAGSATSVPWSGVTGKPETFTPSEHTHLYASSSTSGGAATRAINDNKDQEISSTYIKNIISSGTTITATRGDGSTFSFDTQDTDTTYSVFKAATSSLDGSSGLVPTPTAGKQDSFLRGDGTWVVPTDTKYTHPSYAEQASGLYKITVDASGHISDVTAVAKSDITALGIPSTNTTYSVATTSDDGLMSSIMVTKMNELDNNVISETQPSNPSTGYTMWYNVLSTE